MVSTDQLAMYSLCYNTAIPVSLIHDGGYKYKGHVSAVQSKNACNHKGRPSAGSNCKWQHMKRDHGATTFAQGQPDFHKDN